MPVEKASLGGMDSPGSVPDSTAVLPMAEEGPSGIIRVPGRVAFSPHPSSSRRPANERDRRGAYRLQAAGRRVELRSRGGRELEVLDLSVDGIRLRVPSARDLAVLDEPMTLHLGASAPVVVRIQPTRALLDEVGNLTCGARMDRLPRSALTALNRFLLDEFRDETPQPLRVRRAADALRTRKPRMIRQLLERHGIDAGPNVRAYRMGRRVRAKIELVALRQERGACMVALSSGAESLEPGTRYDFVLAAGACLLLFSCAVREEAFGFLLIDLPAEISQAGFRDCARISPDASNGLRLSFPHPRIPAAILVRCAEDASAGGLAFAIDSRTDLLVPGDRLDDFTIRTPMGAISAVALVRSITPTATGPERCGVELVRFAETESEERWKHFVFSAMHPRMSVGGADAVDRSWRALEASSYVSLWTSETKRRRLEESYRRQWRSVSASGGRLFLLRDDEDTVATCALSLLYPRSWMVHHFGVDVARRSDTRDFAREIYSGFIFAFQHMSEQDYLVIYVEDGKRWNELMYTRFVERSGLHDRLLWSRFEVFRRDATMPLVDEEPGYGIEIERICAGDIRARTLTERLRAELTPMELDAFSLRPDELFLDEFERRCRDHGYERSRRVFVATVDGVLLAALIAEKGGEGVNVFGLLNRCWIVPLEDAGDGACVRRRLLRRAADHYRESGCAEFLFFGGRDEGGGVPGEVGFERVSGGMRWLSRRDVMPSWLGHVEDVLGRLGSSAGDE